MRQNVDCLTCEFEITIFGCMLLENDLRAATVDGAAPTCAEFSVLVVLGRHRFAPRCYDQDQHESQECYPSGGTWDGFGTSIDDPDGTRMCFSCNDIEHYSTHLFASRATTVIHEHATKNRNVSTPQPLFLYFPLQDTHGPVEVPSLYKDAAAPEIVDNLRREIAGKLAAVDEAINNVTEALKVSHSAGFV